MGQGVILVWCLIGEIIELVRKYLILELSVIGTKCMLVIVKEEVKYLKYFGQEWRGVKNSLLIVMGYLK
jgi:hypothetical protein